MNLLFVQIPSTPPSFSHPHPAVLAKVFVPARFCCAAASFLDSRPIRYVRHLERVRIGVCEEIVEHDEGNIAGASTALIVSDLILRNRCLR